MAQTYMDCSPEFVRDFITRTVEVTSLLPGEQEDVRYAAFAIGILAGAAIHDWVAFSDEMLSDAAKCRSWEGVLDIERRSYIERITVG